MAKRIKHRLIVNQIRQHASDAGLSPRDWADKFNKFNPNLYTQRGPMAFDPDTIELPQEFHERMDKSQWSSRQREILAARQGAAQAVEALRHQWPEWITREPTAEDANEDGWVQTLSDGCIDLTDFRHTNGQPWLHTPGWRPKLQPTLKQQALGILAERSEEWFNQREVQVLYDALFLVPDAPDTTP